MRRPRDHDHKHKAWRRLLDPIQNLKEAWFRARQLARRLGYEVTDHSKDPIDDDPCATCTPEKESKGKVDDKVQIKIKNTAVTDDSDAAALLAPERKGAQAKTLPAQWLIDSGSSYDLIGKYDWKRKIHGKHRLDRPEPLFTAAGQIEVDFNCNAYVPCLRRNFTPLLVDEAPAVLSQGRLSAELGYTYHWQGFAKKPYLESPKGERFYLDVNNYVPFLEAKATPRNATPAIADGCASDTSALPAGMPSLEQVERAARKAQRDAERQTTVENNAEDIWHLMTHRCKNPHCPTCQIAKMQRTQCRSHEPFAGTEFGKEICADTIVANATKNWGLDGEEY